MQDSHPLVGLLSLQSGRVTALPYDRKSRDDRRMLVHLQGWERVDGHIKLYVKRETQQGMAGPEQWTDVYMKQGDQEPVNLSMCRGAVCG